MAKVTERREVPIDRLYVNGENVRKEVGDLTDLENSIEHHGVLEPIVVRPGKDGKYAIVIGGRRYRAAKNVGLKAIPAIVKELTDEEAFAESAAENIQRANLSPNEEAEMYHRAYEMKKGEGGEEAVAKMFDVSRGEVKRQLEAWRLIQTFRAARPHAATPKLPEDRTKTETISRAAKGIFPDAPKKQIELFEVLRDLPRDEVKRAVEYVKAKVEREPEKPTKDPVEKLVKEAFKAPVVQVDIRFSTNASRGIIRAAEEYGVSWEDIVRMAVEEWLREGGY